MYIIPAHSNLISQVKYEPQEGYFLVTSSYDMTAKVLCLPAHLNLISQVCFKCLKIVYTSLFISNYSLYH